MPVINFSYSDYINELFLYFDINIEDEKSLVSKIITMFLWFVFFGPVIIVASLLYSFLLVLIPRSIYNAQCKGRKICVARSFATQNKLSFLSEDGVIFYSEKPFSIRCNNNLYSIPLLNRFNSLLSSIKHTFKDVFKLGLESARYLNVTDSFKIFFMYLPRIPHKVNFAGYFEQLVILCKPSVIITGNKEDRFALVEENVSRSNLVKLICYPHGLEYAMRLPRGVVGDEFYCYSDATRVHYSKIYLDRKQVFYFIPEIVSKLLGKNLFYGRKEKNLVFFPESRDKEVNYKIVTSILNKNLPLFIKLHPLDSASNYISLGIKPENIIEKFDDAISCNIVLARKSTVLLEALYSGSYSCALLFDDSDYENYMKLFPSLWDNRIEKFRCVEEMLFWLSNIGFNPR